jgi:hypothetical protein
MFSFRLVKIAIYCLRFPIKDDNDTNSVEITKITVDIAFTSGVTPIRTIPYIESGRVVEPAGATIK